MKLPARTSHKQEQTYYLVPYLKINHSDLFPSSEAALARWSEGHSDALPTGAGAQIQKNWDSDTEFGLHPTTRCQ